MRILITEKQFEFIESQRTLLGHGADHKVYTVFKDDFKVVKIGAPSTISFYAECFNEFNDVFPKVYKVGTRMINDKIRGYMYLETLSNSEFFKKIDELNKWFELSEIGLISRKPNKKIFNPEDLDNFEKNAPEDIKEFLNDFIELCKKLQERKKYFLQKDKSNIMIGHLDLHFGNFGMDKDGKVKCLDF